VGCRFFLVRACLAYEAAHAHRRTCRCTLDASHIRRSPPRAAHHGATACVCSRLA